MCGQQQFHAYIRHHDHHTMCMPYTTCTPLQLTPACLTPLQSAGGILLPESGKKLNEGEVVAVGNGFTTRDGTVVKPNVAPGDLVCVFRCYAH